MVRPLSRLAPLTHKRSLAPRTLLGIAEIFKTLSDPTRLRILSALADAGPRELCVHQLCQRLGLQQSAASHQLRLLRVGRMVAARREGREIFYSLLDAHVPDLIRAARAHAEERRS